MTPRAGFAGYPGPPLGAIVYLEAVHVAERTRSTDLERQLGV